MMRKLDRERSGLSWRLVVRVIIFLVVLALAGIGAWIYRDSIRTKVASVFAVGEEEPIPVQLLEKRTFRLNIPAAGEIVGLKTYPVSTPSTSAGGLKIAWLIPEGSFVKPGDMLVRYDSTDIRLSLEGQQNVLEANRLRTDITTGKQDTDERVLVLDHTDAEKEYEYAMMVLPQDETIFSKWDIIEAKIGAALAKERISFLENKARAQKRIASSDRRILTIEKEKALADVAIAQETLDALELVSARDGLVIYRRDRTREPQIGDESWAGQVLIELVDLEVFQARLYVLERDAANLAKDKVVIIRLDALPGREFRGVVRSVAALAQPLERNSPLKYFICGAAIYDAGGDLKRIKPGMSLKADIIIEEYDSCFVVPAGAVTVRDSEAIVYVKQGNQFIPRTVKLGATTHGQAAILSGIQEGEIIAMRNPLEARRAHLPDFGKASADTSQGPRGGGPSPRMRP